MTTVTWLDIDRRFLVIERVDRGTASGVREVSFVLATSDLPEIEIPDLPVYEDAERPEYGQETQTITEDDPIGTLLGSLGLPPGGGGGGLPGKGGSLLPDCCDDNATAVTSVSTS